MKDIKRYNCDVYYDRGMYEHSSGDFVSYEDLAAIVAEKDARISELEFMLQKNAVKDGNEIYTLLQQLSRYSMSAGQRKAESDAVRVALGFGADADDVAPCDLVDAIITLQEQVRSLAAENSIQDFIISAVKDLVSESEGVAGWHLNGDIASWNKALPELNHSETPATDAALREIRAQGVVLLADRRDAAGKLAMSEGDERIAISFYDEAARARMFADRIRAGEQP